MAKNNEVGVALLRIAPTLRDFVEQLRRDVEQSRPQWPDVEINVKPKNLDRFVAEIQAAIQAAKDDVEVDVDANTSGASAHVDAWRDEQSANDLNLGVDVDTSAASAQLSAWRARQESEVITQRIRVVRENVGGDDDSTASAGRVGGVVQNIGGISLFQLSNISAALAGVNAIVAALGGAVAAAGAAATALGAMGAVGVVGGMGVFKAFAGLKQDAENSTNAVQTAAEQQVNALERVQDAQRGVADASRDLRARQADMATAYKDATRAVRDQNMELQDAVLSQEEAAIGVARARERLAEVNRDARAGKASGLDVQEALLGVRSAQSRLNRSQQRVADSREDTAQVNRQGVDNHEIVRDGRERVAESERRLADAHRNLARSAHDLATATDRAATTQSHFDKAMAKLSPNAKDFVNDIRSLSDEWTGLRQAVEGELFEGLGDRVVRFAKTQLPALQTGMVALAGTLNTVLSDTMTRVGDTFTEFTNNGTFDAFISGVQQSFSGFDETVDGVVRALTGLTVEIGPQLGVFFQQLGTFLAEGTPMWATFGRETVEGIGNLLPTINELFSFMLPIARELLPYFGQALQALADGLGANQGTFKEFNAALGGALVNMIRAAVPLLAAFARVLTTVFNAIAGMNPTVLAWVAGFALIGAAVLRTMIGLGNFVSRIGTVMATIRTLAGSRLLVGFFGAIRAAAMGLVGVLGRLGIALRGMFLAMTATPMGKMVVGIAALAAALVLLYQKSETFRNIISKIGQALSKVFGGPENAQAAATFAPLLLMLGKFSSVANIGTKALGLLKGAIGAVGVAFRALGVAFMSNPIGLIITAVVALGVALWAFFTKTETGRKVWRAICEALKAAWDWVTESLGKSFQWLQDRWDTITRFFQENKWVKALLNPIDTIKNGFRIMVDFVGGLFSRLKRVILEALLWPARAVGGVLQKVPSWIPGSGRVRDFGNKLASVRIVERRNGGPIPKAVRQDDGMIVGPGTPTSDSIVAVDANGVPVARVSTEEGITNARGMKKHRALFDAINRDDPRLNNLPGFDQGGALDGSVPSARKILGDEQWDKAWQDYFRSKGADTPDKAYRYMNPGDGNEPEKVDGRHAKLRYKEGDLPKGYPPPIIKGSPRELLGSAEWDRRWQQYFLSKGEGNPDDAYTYMRTRPAVRERYKAGFLPPQGAEESSFSYSEAERRNQSQRVKEIKDGFAEESRAKRARKAFDEAWTKWFNEHGGNDNRDKYLERNPEIKERWNTGVFPPGDERRQEDIQFNPDGSIKQDDFGLGDPSLSPGGSDSGMEIPDSGYDPFAGTDYGPPGDQNGAGGTSKLQEAANRAVAAGEQQGIDVAVQISDPDSGMSMFAGKQGQFPSASVIKLLVAAAAANQIDTGKLTADQVRPLLNPMISNSSNDATNSLIDMLGGFDAINSAGSKLGISGADAHLGRKLGIPVSGEDPNRMSARGVDALLTLFSQSARGKNAAGKPSLSKSSAQMVVDAMKNQSVDTKFGSNLPNEKIAHKTGELGGASHDVGYFFDGERWLQVSILTNKAGSSSQEANNRIIQAFGKEVFEARGERPGTTGAGAPVGGGQSGIPSGEAADRAMAVAKRYGDGRPYEYGNIDCSGYMSRIYAAYKGLPDKRYFTTEDDFEGKFGFVKGLVPGAFQIGVMRGGGGPNSHMVGTMHDGTAVESGGAHNTVAFGGPAKGAKDLPLHWSLPMDRWNPPGKAAPAGSSGYEDITLENVDPGPDGMLGTDDDIALGGGSDAGGGETDTYTEGEWAALSPVEKLFPQLGDKKSPRSEMGGDRFNVPGMAGAAAYVGVEELMKGTGLENSVLSGRDLYAEGVDTPGKKPPGYDPAKLSLPGMASKAASIVAEGVLSFFDFGGTNLNNSILGAGNEYNSAAQDAYNWYDDLKRQERNAKEKDQIKPKTDNVGSGDVTDPKTDDLQVGYDDPTKTPQAAQALVPKNTPEGGIAAGSPGAKEAFWAEWNSRGWTSPNEWFDTLRLFHGESGWNERAKNPASTAEGVPQFLDSTRKQFGWGPTAKEQAGPAAKYIESRADYGRPSKAYAMWKSRSPHWYRDGGPVSGPGGPRDDAIEARLSNGEFVTNAASTEKAGPLLELINSSPDAAENAMNALAGPAGAAVNAVAPGAGSAVAAGISFASGAVKAGLRPVANTATGFLSEFERSNLAPRPAAVKQMTPEQAKQSTNSGNVDRSIHIERIEAFNPNQWKREMDDKQAADALRYVPI